ncbi:MAG TPA: choice-of-anchor tandem repeat GloVer-containing protein [Rhizomicrobium sp.]
MANLVMDASGNLFGTTADGGASNLGTAFRLAPDGVRR